MRFFIQGLLKHKFHNIVTFTSAKKGGHFMAFEEPTFLAEDFWAFAAQVEEARSRKKKRPKSEL
jgi:hypothetical protein